MTLKTKTILIWIISILLAFVFFSAGITKIIGLEDQIKNLESWGFPLWLRFPIGIIEVVMAVGFLIPRLRKLACNSIFPWLVVALFTHLQSTPPQYEGIVVPIVFAVLAEVILLLSKDNSEKIIP
jgi:uncharacterized membrane protein YphA (DoxX/SURF4 family)